MSPVHQHDFLISQKNIINIALYKLSSYYKFMRTQYAEFLHFAGHHTTSILLHNNLNVTLRYTKYNYRLQVKQTYINQYQNLESHKLIA